MPASCICICCLWVEELIHSFCSALVRLCLEYCAWFGALQQKRDMGILEFSGGQPRWLGESGVYDILLEIEEDEFVHQQQGRESEHLSSVLTYVMRRHRWSQTHLEVHTTWRKCNDYKETPVLKHWEMQVIKIIFSTVNVTKIFHLWLYSEFYWATLWFELEPLWAEVHFSLSA